MAATQRATSSGSAIRQAPKRAFCTRSLDEAEAHLARVDGVMIGRAAYQNPYLLAEADRRVFGDERPPPGREDIVRALLPYAVEQCAQGVPIKSIARHTLGLFNGLPGARAWRRHLSEAAHRPGAGPEVIEDALDVVRAQLEARGVAA
jgi:tRNA-dihydrouridine synthase A